MNSTTFQLSSFMPYRLAVLSERTSRSLSVVYEKISGLNVAEWRVLVHLGRSDRVSVREIHNCVNLEKSRVSRAVKKLDASGLVEKLPAEDDARLVEISLSDNGRAVLSEILPHAMLFEQNLLSNLTQQELQTFCDIMEKMHAAMDKMPNARPRSQKDLQPASTPATTPQ